MQAYTHGTETIAPQATDEIKFSRCFQMWTAVVAQQKSGGCGFESRLVIRFSLLRSVLSYFTSPEECFRNKIPYEGASLTECCEINNNGCLLCCLGGNRFNTISLGNQICFQTLNEKLGFYHNTL